VISKFGRIFCDVVPSIRASFATAILLGLVPGLIDSALAQQSSSSVQQEEPRFDITGIEVKGSAVLSRGEVDQAVAPYVGKNKTFADLRAAVQAIEKLYAARGVAAVRVILPEQTASGGRFTVQVIEARIGSIQIDGNEHRDDANVRLPLVGLVEGEPPDMRSTGLGLRLANESPSKQTKVILRPGRGDSQVDAVVRVKDENPLRAVLYADNTGTEQTGNYRTGLAIQHSNLFNRDHTLSAQYATSPTHASDVQVYGLGYRIPLYAWGDAVEVSYGHSNVDSGHVSTAAGGYDISGRGTTYGLKYEQNFAKIGEWEHKLIYAIEQREYESSVIFTGTSQSIVPNLASRPLSLTYRGVRQTLNGQIDGYVGISHNLSGNNNNDDDAYNQVGARPGSKARFTVWKWGANFSASSVSDWILRLSTNGQYTSDKLISGEQFGLGGADSVRGFHERALADDRGIRGSIEVYTPDLGPNWLGEKWSLRALGFWDGGHLWRNDPIAGQEEPTQTVGSIGLGLRSTFNRKLSIRLDAAVVTHAGDSEGRGDARGHFSLMYQF
jgi:hemolysin activation/secretion protein